MSFSRDDEGSEATRPYFSNGNDRRQASPGASPPPHTVEQLKRQVARQQEKLDRQAAALDQRAAEVEALRAERAVLVDELAAVRRAAEDPVELDGSECSRGRFPRRGDGGGGSMQLLVDVNSKLMVENARLQAEAEVLRKAFHAHVRESQLEQSMSERTARSSRTSQASSLASDVPRDVVTLTASQASLRHDSSRESLQSILEELEPSHQTSQDSIHEILDTFSKPIPAHGTGDFESFGTSGDDWITADEDAEELQKLARSARERRAARKKRTAASNGDVAAGGEARDLLVPFQHAPHPEHAEGTRRASDGGAVVTERGEAERKDHARMARRMSASLVEGTANGTLLRSQELLVDFGKKPRDRDTSRLWSSLKIPLTKGSR